MSNLLKLAIPLLNTDIKLSDIDSTTGFVGAYFEDINKPYLTDHMFLMYDDTVKGDNVAKRFYKLSKLNSCYGKRIITIKGKLYTVYIFTINSTIKRLRDGNIMLSVDQKQRILDFWDHKDPWITNNVLLGTMYEHPEPQVLPEEDYVPEWSGDEEGEALFQSASPLFVLLFKYNNLQDSQSHQ